MVKGIQITLYLLALLAFMLTVRYLIRRKWQGEMRRPVKSLVLVVRDRQEMIEGILRKAVQKRNGSAANIELIVIDNGSRDETPGIVSRLARNPGGFIFISAGACQNLRQLTELGLKMSRGEKICFLGLKENMTLHDMYISLDEVIVKNPSGSFLPRQCFVELQQ
jgi:hypothetical protein